MLKDIDREKKDIIGKVTHLAGKHAPKKQAGLLKDFIRQFYREVPTADLDSAGEEELFAIARSFWEFANETEGGKPHVRVFNPVESRHGWSSEHTVVETVNPDMPFLVDSITNALGHMGMEVLLVIHPIVKVKRSKKGRITQVLALDESDEQAENISCIHVQVLGQPDGKLNDIKSRIDTVLKDVHVAVRDWQPMQDKVHEIIDELATPPKGVVYEEVSETRAFLEWTLADHFTFLGYREYDFTGSGKDLKVKVRDKSGMGILAHPNVTIIDELRHLGEMPADVRAFTQEPELLMVIKADKRAAVHRTVFMDVLAVKRFDDKGKPTGYRLFAGLFTSTAYSRSPRTIPVLRRKFAEVMRQMPFSSSSHNAKVLAHILDTYPRDELFQISASDLKEIAMGILELQERQRVALFLRHDDFNRAMSCLVYIPRDLYDTDLRLQFQSILESAFDGELVTYNTEVTDQPLARVLFIIRTDPTKKLSYDEKDLEAQLIEAARTWEEGLRQALIKANGEDKGIKLFERYAEAFPAGYKEFHDATSACADIQHMERLCNGEQIGLNLYRPKDDGNTEHGVEIRFKIYHPDTAVPLSDVLPVLENMGLKVIDERPFRITINTDDDERVVMMHDFGMRCGLSQHEDFSDLRDDFEDAFIRIWRREMEDDGFNKLVIGAGLRWREIVILRTYAKYLRQARAAFSQNYMQSTLSHHPKIARMLVNMFLAKFDPKERKRYVHVEALKDDIYEALDEVDSADEDRIIRRFLNLVESTLRTNYFQSDRNGRPKKYVSVKFDSRNITSLPAPKPMAEIFVYSTRTEGVHLRAGKIARGGIRWSDRREDFRTEILGLEKAQIAKNAVIVPTGAKGGFVVKHPPETDDREEQVKEAIYCYRTLIKGMLDITDNYKGTRVITPPDVVRYDEDDPYLVVAADKGTASFSDIANELSEKYGFWLGDAFASGGSNGYDHKKMGITARGAWESVKRHFREMDRDPQNEDFTCVGVGDMSGDVFGNGMLLSKHIKLVGAFNHKHIFIDPDPDPEKSFKERQRLFKKARSGWNDYDEKVLSTGGRIYKRTAKTVTLTKQIKDLLGVKSDSMSPNDLIILLLKYEADLLWFGGIGTYVKASHEKHAEVGDRSNEAVRVDARELNAKVVGEGANLAVTHLGRIEYALRGGRINADSIDNSGGVDCSDHEVNIKILLDNAVRRKALSMKQRNNILVKMTDDVAQLVLRNNYLQTQGITLFASQGAQLLDYQTRLMRMLERMGRLDRAVEYLPNDDELAERQANKTGLTRPEISVLMPHGKIWLFDEIMASDLPDDPWLSRELVHYFPDDLHEKYSKDMESHRLRREIIATEISSNLVNRTGGTFITQIMEKSGCSAAQAAKSYIVTRDLFELAGLWHAIEALDTKVPAETQTRMLLEVNRLVERGTLWFCRNTQEMGDIGSIIETFKGAVNTLREKFDDVVQDGLREDLDARATDLEEEGVPADLATRISRVVAMVASLDIGLIAEDCGRSLEKVAEVYFAVGARFHFRRLRSSTREQPGDSHWQKLALSALLDEFFAHQLELTTNILADSEKDWTAEEAIKNWANRHRADVEATDQLFGEFTSGETIDVAMLTVASRQLRDLSNAP